MKVEARACRSLKLCAAAMSTPEKGHRPASGASRMKLSFERDHARFELVDLACQVRKLGDDQRSGVLRNSRAVRELPRRETRSIDRGWFVRRHVS